MLCPNCQHSNTTSAKFCENCGFKLSAAAPATVVAPPTSPPASPTARVNGIPDSDIQRLEKLVPKEFAQRLLQSRTGRIEGERRIVTILFCDVKGSTALGEEHDPEEILEIMNGAFESLIEPVYRYEGTLARLMGDAILAFFGAPIAHEDDSERACLAALAIQEKIAVYASELQRSRGIENFGVRVGINTGLVVVGEVGSDLRVEYTAMGDAINLASRMEQAAEPGEIVITENTARLARHAIQLESLGALTVKGKAEPVNAYRVRARKSVPESQRGIAGLSSPLVGRTAELRTLREYLDGLQQGHGHIVSVIGDAGLGKSRLTAELYQGFVVGENAPQWFEARSRSYETQTPYAPFVDLFRHIFDITIEDSDETASEKLNARLQSLLGAEGENLKPFLATVLGLQLTGDDWERVRYLLPPFLRGRITQATAVLVGSLAQQPTVIVFEDLHWADATSLEILSALLPLATQAPVLFLALLRPNKTDPAWQFHGNAAAAFPEHYTAIELSPLDEAASRELVANLLQIEDLPANVRALILQKAEGNPFYVEEVIRSLLDQKLVVRDGDHWRATREISNIAIPNTLAGVITARLDRLDEESKRTAQTASILGREFEYAPLYALTDVTFPLEPSLDTLQARELVRRKELAPLPAYLFKHALTQETAYNSMLLSTRRNLHKRAAAFLVEQQSDAVNEIARHWLDAQETERALPFLLTAASRAARAYATTEALAYYTRAQEIAVQLGDVPAVRRAYEGIGGALSFTPEMPRAVQVYQEMFAAGQKYNDILMQISALNKQANLLALRMGQMDQAEPLLRQAEQLARAHEDKVGLGEMFVIRCQISVGMSDFDSAMQYMGDAVQVGKDLEHQEQIAWGLDHLASTYVFMGRFDEAKPILQEGWTLATSIGNREYQSGILLTRALMEWRNGVLDTALETAKQSADTAEGIGLSIQVVLGKWAASWICRQSGDYEAALNTLQQVLAIAEPMVEFVPFLTVVCKAALGSVLLDMGGDRDAAIAFHKHALELAATPIGGMGNGGAWADIGACALNLGNLALAQDLFTRALEHPSFFRILMKPRNQLGLAELAIGRREFGNAQAWIDQARALIDETQMLPFQPFVALTQGNLFGAQGDPQRALDEYRKAETSAAALTLRPAILQARLGAADALKALGNSDAAIIERTRARAMIQEMADLIQTPQLRHAYLENALSRLQGHSY